MRRNDRDVLPMANSEQVGVASAPLRLRF
jgi:hypothetical protein